MQIFATLLLIVLYHSVNANNYVCNGEEWEKTPCYLFDHCNPLDCIKAEDQFCIHGNDTAFLRANIHELFFFQKINKLVLFSFKQNPTLYIRKYLAKMLTPTIRTNKITRCSGARPSSPLLPIGSGTVAVYCHPPFPATSNLFALSPLYYYKNNFRRQPI